MKRSLVATLGVLLVASSVAWAGRANYFETTVNLVTRTAFGSLYDTRGSADTVQYIGCSLNSSGDFASLICEAKDAASEKLVCQSTNAELIKVGQSLSDSSYIYFNCDASYNLTYLYVGNSSIWLR
jgi:hypothetical protein